MAVKLRLQRKGRKHAPFYHIVAADARTPRDGRFIEKIGTYNPLTVPATIELTNDRALYWISVGAQPTDTVNAILRFKGVLYEKHLQTGVRKGALTEEQAAAKLAEYVQQKENAVEKRRKDTATKRAQAKVQVDGTPKVKAKPVVEAPPAPVEEAAAEEAVVAAAEVAETAAPEVVVEAAVAEVAETTEAATEVVEEAAAAAETTEAAAE
jgi:small subunit ribosomal protein S16